MSNNDKNNQANTPSGNQPNQGTAQAGERKDVRSSQQSDATGKSAPGNAQADRKDASPKGGSPTKA